MDEVSNEMGIEMNDSNIDNHVTETKSNSRLIKERFTIAYYWLSYKKIPMIMISHLAMNVT